MSSSFLYNIISEPVRMLHDSNARAARLLLRVTFGLLAIIVGIDTFTNVLVNWSAYLAPQLAALPYANMLMKVGAVVQIIAGVLVLMPRTAFIGAIIITAWLFFVTIDVALIGVYDVALRDAALTLGALALVKLESGTRPH